MKQPTTEYAIAMQEQVQINREFLLSQGWELKDEKPLYETFVHKSDPDVVCSIGAYGEFSIAELHWCNKTPDREFTTINPRLTTDDYFKIIDLLSIQRLKK